MPVFSFLLALSDGFYDWGSKREGRGFLGAEFSSYFHLPDLRPWGFIRLKMRFPNFTFGRSLRQLVSRTRLNSCRAALLLIHKANEKTRKGGRALSHWGALGMQPGDVRHSHPSTQPDQAHSATAPIINMPCCKGVSSAAPLSVQVRGGGEHPNCDCWFWEPHGWKHPAATEAARKTKGHSPQGEGTGSSAADSGDDQKPRILTPDTHLVLHQPGANMRVQQSRPKCSSPCPCTGDLEKAPGSEQAQLQPLLPFRE